MGDFLSREQLIKDSIITEEVDYRDGKVLIREMSGHTVQKFFEDGIIENIVDPDTEEIEVKVHMEKLNLQKIAAVSIIDPKTYDPVMSLEDIKKVPFELTQSAALTALRLTKFGQEVPEEDDAEEGTEEKKKEKKS